MWHKWGITCVHSKRHVAGGGDNVISDAAIREAIADVVVHCIGRGGGEDREHPDGAACASCEFGHTLEDRRAIARLGYARLPRGQAGRCRSRLV